LPTQSEVHKWIPGTTGHTGPDAIATQFNLSVVRISKLVAEQKVGRCTLATLRTRNHSFNVQTLTGWWTGDDGAVGQWDHKSIILGIIQVVSDGAIVYFQLACGTAAITIHCITIVALLTRLYYSVTAWGCRCDFAKNA
jgi:hypothetical protein